MDEFKQECKLCDGIIRDKSFKIIDDDTNYIFSVLLLKLALENETRNVICQMCSSKLLAAFTFKLKCLKTENTIISYVDFENPTIVDLKDIYAKENESNQGSRVLDDWEICRLCLHPMSREDRPVQEVPISSIQVFIPEVNFAGTSTPTICINCHDELCVHNSFIRNCLDVEEKRNMNGIKIEGIFLANTLIKTEEIEIKSEKIDEGEKPFEVLHNVENAERDTTVHFRNGLSKTEETNTRNDLDHLKQTQKQSNKGDSSHRKATSEVRMYGCDKCDYKTIRKGNLRRHQLSCHPDVSELQIYKCDECDYECIRQCHLKTHQLTHKDPSELPIYKCDKCKFQTRHRGNLFTHNLRHKDPSEVRMFECDECDYKSMQKGALKRHQLRHKDTSEVQMYNCDKCNFKTKHKESLIHHFLQHKDPSEARMFECDECDYKSVYKHLLKQHQLRHKDPSETRVYKCVECDYKSKYKHVLLRHTLVHKDPSEVRMFECDECDYKSIHKHLLKQHKLKHKDP